MMMTPDPQLYKNSHSNKTFPGCTKAKISTSLSKFSKTTDKKWRDKYNDEEEKQFLVSESCLAAILRRYSICNRECQSSVLFTRGTMFGTETVCLKWHVSHWESQKCHNRMPYLLYKQYLHLFLRWAMWPMGLVFILVACFV